MSVVSSPVTINLAGKTYEMKNTLEVRKQFCIHLGGLRPVLECVMNIDEWRMAQVIAIASGNTKKVDKVFEGVFNEGATSVASQISDYINSLIDSDDDEDEPKNGDEETSE